MSDPASFLFKDELLVGSKYVVGKYNITIEKYLSEGGFSHVYAVQAFSNAEGSPLSAVLKRMYAADEQALNHIKSEINTMKLLKSNPKIVTYYDSCVLPLSEEKKDYEVLLLMEYCSGGGLIDFMNQRLQTRLSEAEVLKILSDVTQGVAAMHRLRPPLIHRDLKVENILMTSFSSFKLCDFGSVTEPMHAAENSTEIHALEKNLATFTTYQYRAPEMINFYAGLAIDEKSDMWALGVLLYKLCYYTTPFETQGPNAILTASYAFPPFPHYSHSLKNIIIALLQPNPCLRPNIFQLMYEVCRLRGKPLPFGDFYAGNDPSFYDMSNRKVMSLVRQSQGLAFNQQIPSSAPMSASHIQTSRPPVPPMTPPTYPSHPVSNPFYVQADMSGASQKIRIPVPVQQNMSMNHPVDLGSSRSLSYHNQQAISRPASVVTDSVPSTPYVSSNSKNPFPVSHSTTGASSHYAPTDFAKTGSKSVPEFTTGDLEDDIASRYPDLSELEAQVTNQTDMSSQKAYELSKREDEIAKLADDAFASFLRPTESNSQDANVKDESQNHPPSSSIVMDAQKSEKTGSSDELPGPSHSFKSSSAFPNEFLKFEIQDPQTTNHKSPVNFETDALAGPHKAFRHSKSLSQGLPYSSSHSNLKLEGDDEVFSSLRRRKSTAANQKYISRPSTNPYINPEELNYPGQALQTNEKTIPNNFFAETGKVASNPTSSSNPNLSDTEDKSFFPSFNQLERTSSIQSDWNSHEFQPPMLSTKNPYLKQLSPESYANNPVHNHAEYGLNPSNSEQPQIQEIEGAKNLFDDELQKTTSYPNPGIASATNDVSQTVPTNFFDNETEPNNYDSLSRQHSSHFNTSFQEE
ncbi:NAK protein kinase Ppk29 [Schizosaccharomyces cryophilus OY26]|uniref:NAK protein kinase Ppk29 n=1 Tax=Schizosaccharomyces cryophilus (strain OY26 / ATCC MYA-4695 / CBS 11777 / NBRC 106824 / NRRL Y48691) TaxID=653667 RepID=S9XCT9_SCHCR|nr:NAK protein kinase Ppk29 [Schizosaccharomyces cryophilus OY26]EPY51661.1 NAK protein kinase Ppk29 [Schizosaccharomyces cryophilus OY26]